MSLSVGNNGILSADQGVDIPFSISVYLLDSCKQGTVFDQDTYQLKALKDWISGWFETVGLGIPVPKEFSGTRLSQIFSERINSFLNESKLEKTFESIKDLDVKSIKELIEKNRKMGQKQADLLGEHLRTDEFPPCLWMEYNRINKTFSEVSQMLTSLVDRMYQFAPKRISDTHARNRLVRAKCTNYSELIDGYFNAMSAYFRLSMYFEVWSCKDEKDFFTDKCVWTFKNVDKKDFDSIFISFHDSVSNLRQAFLKIQSVDRTMNFSKPTDWAFKQLILMT